MAARTLEQRIAALLSDISGGEQVPIDSLDVFGACRIDGDDANEFVDAFADEFNVDMGEFLWYFHYVGDEPPGRRNILPVLPTGEVVPIQPVAIWHLSRAAQEGRWVWNYPEHRIRSLRLLHGLQYVMVMIAVIAIAWLVLVYSS